METVLFERSNQPTNLAFKDAPSFYVQGGRLHINYGYRHKVKEGVDIQFNLVSLKEGMLDKILWSSKSLKPFSNGVAILEIEPGEYRATVAVSGNAGWSMKVYQK